MTLQTYPVEKHGITSDKIDSHAYYVIEKLKQAGFIAYLVGGGVRDLLLNTRPKDFDVVTSATPEEVRKIFRNCILIGRRFRLAHVRFGRQIIEVATFRSGDIESSSLILRDNIWGSPEDDAIRRDFTINGLFYDPSNQTIIDYVNGIPDIETKTLRTIGHPEMRFMQDPVRMIRLLKFHARFGLNIDPVTQSALFKCQNELVKSSPARILEELLRMLELGSSKKFFQSLHTHGFLKILLPNFERYLSQRPDSLIYPLLEQADIYNHKNHPKPLDRSVLLASLMFSILEEQLKGNLSHTHPHLGTIFEISQKLIHNMFAPFFTLSRKMKMTIASILTSQFRLTPLSGELPKRLRIPKDPVFPLALDFLKLRCSVDANLLKTYTLWHEALISFHQHRQESAARPVHIHR